MAGPECGVCGDELGEGVFFCQACGVLRSDNQGQLFRASKSKRLGAAILDAAIPFLLSIIPFVGIVAWSTWLLWFAVIAPRGQSPGKQLSGSWVHYTSGLPARWTAMWGRQVIWAVLWWLLFIVGVAVGTASDGAIAGLLWGGLLAGFGTSALYAASVLPILFDPDQRALHDRLFDTLVIERAAGYMPPDRGAIARARRLTK